MNKTVKCKASVKECKGAYTSSLLIINMLNQKCKGLHLFTILNNFYFILFYFQIKCKVYTIYG